MYSAVRSYLQKHYVPMFISVRFLYVSEADVLWWTCNILHCTVTNFIFVNFLLSVLFDSNCNKCVIQECTSEVEVWHDDVQFYKIFNKAGNGLTLLVFFLLVP